MASTAGELHRPGAGAPPSEFETATYKKVAWRLSPLLLICYVVAYLDRVNVGFAKLQMSTDLGLSDAVYGFGAGIFFFGYFIFEIPSNVILHKVGARVWIARIMITWGIISALTMFITTPTMFYVMRFMLGVAEAGFFPGIILYLTYWFPAERRGRTHRSPPRDRQRVRQPLARQLDALGCPDPLHRHPLAPSRPRRGERPA